MVSRVARADGFVEIGEEGGAGTGEGFEDGLSRGARVRRLCAGWEQGSDAVGEIEAMRPSRSPSESKPHQTTSPAAMRVSRSAGSSGRGGRGGFAIEERGGERRALEGFDGVEKGIKAATFLQNALPVGFEAGEETRIGGLDFFT